MAVRMYSTLTGREDEIVPLDPNGELRFYVCGMTPKFHPHLGHARVFVAMDMIRRYLLFRGYRVKYVQNFTDVDDKIIERAAREHSGADSTARKYIDSYFDVMDRLNVRRADEYPTVTGYMERIIEFIAGLVETGHAYSSELGDVWFDVASFPEYGKLSHRDLNSQLVAARKELEPGKRDPRDFALWKHAREGEPSWPSPWGRGRPGWHIECSAMVRETLADQIDIHGGGADLIFPHHENEIAQSESLSGKSPFAQFWAHAGLVVLGGGEKMAHSAENFTTLASILEEYTPVEVRYYLLATQYRSSLTFTVESDGASGPKIRGIEDARAALGRLRRAVGEEPLSPDGPLNQAAVDAFTAAMDADFNTPDALAVIFNLAREINSQRAARELQGDAAGPTTLRPTVEQTDILRRTLVYLLNVLGIDLLSEASANKHTVDESQVELLVDARRRARELRQWAQADAYRAQLATMGVVVEDTPKGPVWRVDPSLALKEAAKTDTPTEGERAPT